MNHPLNKEIGFEQQTGEVRLSLIIDLAKQGVPKGDFRTRYFLYQLILKIFPTDRSQWSKTFQNLADEYSSLLQHYFKTAPNFLFEEFSSTKTNTFFRLEKDDIMKQIYGDVDRTPLEIFQQYNFDDVQNHTRRIERILYIFSQQEKFYSYTQGFNDLLYPIYHVVLMAHQQMEIDLNKTEAISYFLIRSLITRTGLGILFNPEKDLALIQQKFEMIQKMVQLVDQELFDFLFKKLSIDPIQFAFSWVMLLFSQLYCGQDLLLIWDRFFLRDKNLLEYGMSLASAHLVEIRTELIGFDSSKVLDRLFNIHPLDTVFVVARAEDILSQYVEYQATLNKGLVKQNSKGKIKI